MSKRNQKSQVLHVTEDALKAFSDEINSVHGAIPKGSVRFIGREGDVRTVNINQQAAILMNMMRMAGTV